MCIQDHKCVGFSLADSSWGIICMKNSLCETRLQKNLPYGTILYMTIFNKYLLYKTLLCTTFLSKILLHKTLPYRTLLHNSLLCKTLLYKTLFYQTLLYKTLLYKTLLYKTLLYQTLTDKNGNKFVATQGFYCIGARGITDKVMARSGNSCGWDILYFPR